MNLTCLSLWCALPIGYFYFNLPQQRHDLLRLVFLHRHVQLSFRVIFSHSRWTNSSRSRQTRSCHHSQSLEAWLPLHRLFTLLLATEYSVSALREKRIPTGPCYPIFLNATLNKISAFSSVVITIFTPKACSNFSDISLLICAKSNFRNAVAIPPPFSIHFPIETGQNR